jgi:hypothetical protein
LRHHATSQKFLGSIPNEVVGFLHCPIPSSHTVALGSTQPVTEMSPRYLLRGKGELACKAVNLTVTHEPIVSQNVWASKPVTGIAVHFLHKHTSNIEWTATGTLLPASVFWFSIMGNP